MTPPRKKSRRKRDSNPGSSTLEADALTTRPTRRYDRDGETETDIERDRHRDRDTQTYRQSDRQRDGQLQTDKDPMIPKIPGCPSYTHLRSITIDHSNGQWQCLFAPAWNVTHSAT